MYVVLLGTLALAVGMAALLLDRALRRPFSGPDRRLLLEQLGPLDLALLSGGPRGAIEAALGGWLRSGGLHWNPETRLFTWSRHSEARAQAERWVGSSWPAAFHPEYAFDIAPQVTSTVRARLEELGVLLTPNRASLVRWARVVLWVLFAGSSAVLHTLMVFGRGGSRLELAVLLLAFGLGLQRTRLALQNHPIRTGFGERVLRDARAHYASLRANLSFGQSEGLDPSSLQLMIGLFGLGYLPPRPQSAS
jgi:uncharacterized protein (TIGR04222 family)